MYYFYYVAGWHHRVNKQNGAGLGFYRITPLAATGGSAGEAAG